LQEGNQSRLEQRKKEKADKAKMQAEMDKVQAAKRAEEDSQRARMDSIRGLERGAIVEPGTGRRSTTPSMSSKRKLIGL
jgi:hypothetical protein